MSTPVQERPTAHDEEDAAQTKRPRRHREGWIILAFLAPALIVYSVYVLWPIANSFYFSTLDWNGIGEPTQVGLANFTEILGDDDFWGALWHNVVLITASLAFQLPIGLALALLLMSGMKGAKTLRTLYFLPLLMSTVAIGILWSFMYNPTFGAINRSLGAVGLDRLQQAWLGDPRFALASLIVVVCWQFIPFYMILYRAGLTAIPTDVKEAAAIDGANAWNRFRWVTLPLLRGTTRTAVLLSVVGALKYFDLIWVMTGGGPGNATDVLATYMYSEAFSRSRLGYGSAVAVVLFLLALVVTTGVVGRRRTEM